MRASFARTVLHAEAQRAARTAFGLEVALAVNSEYLADRDPNVPEYVHRCKAQKQSAKPIRT